MNELTLQDIYEARLGLAQKRPYLASVLWSLRPIRAPDYAPGGAPTLGASADLRLFFNPASPYRGEDLEVVLLHEAMHIVAEHGRRREKFLPKKIHRHKGSNVSTFNPMAWWIACECEINDDIAGDGFVLPGSPALPNDYHMQNGHIAEEYYAMLRRQGSSLTGTKNTPCGGMFIMQEDKCPDGSDNTPAPAGELRGLLIETAEAIDRWTAAKRAEARKPGMPKIGYSNEALNEISLNIQRRFGNNWQRILAQVIRNTSAKRSGLVDYTFSKPSRRSLPSIILPSFHRPHPKIVTVLDISSSMEGPPSEHSISVLKDIIHACGIDSMTVIPTNNRAHQPITIRRSSTDSIKFGGGTRMPEGHNAALHHNPDIIIIITDGETSWSGIRNPGSVPVVAALVAAKDASKETVPSWMKLIDIHLPSA